MNLIRSLLHCLKHTNLQDITKRFQKPEVLVSNYETFQIWRRNSGLCHLNIWLQPQRRDYSYVHSPHPPPFFYEPIKSNIVPSQSISYPPFPALTPPPTQSARTPSSSNFFLQNFSLTYTQHKFILPSLSAKNLAQRHPTFIHLHLSHHPLYCDGRYTQTHPATSPFRPTRHPPPSTLSPTPKESLNPSGLPLHFR